MRLASILWIIALVLNVVALFLPFMSVTIGTSTEDYSLLHTVNVLWQYDFPYLAVLVGLFSVVFPFAKLLVLAGVNWCGWSPRWATTVGGLGKWSMLDLFLVVLLLAVSYDRLLVSAIPRLGLVCFACAIICAMAVGELLHPRTASETTTERPIIHRRPWSLALAIVGTGLAMTLPLFATDAWFMSDVSYSLVGIGVTLWQAGAVVPALAVAIFLVVMPVLRLVCLVMVSSRGSTWLPAAQFTGRWSMLEPFALALAIFVVEGKSTIPTALGHGGIVLVGAIAISTSASWLLTRR